MQQLNVRSLYNQAIHMVCIDAHKSLVDVLHMNLWQKTVLDIRYIERVNVVVVNAPKNSAGPVFLHVISR